MIEPASVQPVKVIEFLLDNAPNLMSIDDLDRVEKLLKPNQIQTKLAHNYRELSSPQGIAMKSLIRRDPLGFRNILAPRLKTFEALSEATIAEGHVFSNDRKAILLTAKSDIMLTDADGSAQLLTQFNEAKNKLPTTIEAELVSGHVHTNANATTIKQDLLTISTVALVALSLLFVLYFRSFQAIGVFLAPLVAMCAALGALAVFNDSVSAIVIGFGAVLIGISIDFAMHVYFAIARHPGNPGEAAHAVSRPILFCGLTSCAAFGALFLSGMPGIRQLALFSITGLVASAIFSLLVLPHLCRGARIVHKQKLGNNSIIQHPKSMLALWGIVMATCLWFGSSVSIDPDLRSIGYVPKSVQEAEQRFNETWGNIREKAVIFAEGKNLREALSKNERTRSALAANLPNVKAVSMAPLIPSLETQARNRKEWSAFWSPERRQTTVDHIQNQGKAIGFSRKAFKPFEHFLSAQPEDIAPAELDKASLGFLIDMFMPKSQSGKITLVTFLPSSKDIQEFFSPEMEHELGVRLISNSRFKASLEEAMDNDIKHFISISGLTVGLLVFALFRDVRRSCLALLPATTGIAMVFGLLGLTGTSLNLFHITALPLIIGLGADYGIFLVNRETQLSKLATIAAVKVSGLTTLAGFGVLVLAKHPSLHSLGITVLVGVGAALISALYMMPHLLRRHP
ncbi:MAG: MMPL family transporter [Pseudodesulfovibrio sp.]|nr:MMPL family transporter [Pseudodesulfovibrio sp.]